MASVSPMATLLWPVSDIAMIISSLYCIGSKGTAFHLIGLITQIHMLSVYNHEAVRVVYFL